MSCRPQDGKRKALPEARGADRGVEGRLPCVIQSQDQTAALSAKSRIDAGMDLVDPRFMAESRRRS